MAKNLFAELVDQVTILSQNGDIVGPNDEPVDGDVVIGTLPDDLKPLFGALKIVKQKVIAFQKDALSRMRQLGENGDLASKEEVNQISADNTRVHFEYDFVFECFWKSVRSVFPEHIDDNQIGLRKDWQVVSIKPKEVSPWEALSSGLIVVRGSREGLLEALGL